MMLSYAAVALEMVKKNWGNHENRQPNIISASVCMCDTWCNLDEIWWTMQMILMIRFMESIDSGVLFLWGCFFMYQSRALSVISTVCHQYCLSFSTLHYAWEDNEESWTFHRCLQTCVTNFAGNAYSKMFVFEPFIQVFPKRNHIRQTTANLPTRGIKIIIIIIVVIIIYK